MYFILFVFLIIIMALINLKKKNDRLCLEYQEWLTNKGFVKVKLTLFDEDTFDYKSIGVVSEDAIYCYVQSGVYNFVLTKHTYTDIAIYPETPDTKDDIKKTAPIIINTGAVKLVERID